MKKALLVIDMQNVCVGEKHAAYFKYNNRELIRKVKKIIDADRDRKFVVTSACGKETNEDHKVTDLLYLCAAHIKYGVSYDSIFQLIEDKYMSIKKAKNLLRLSYDLDSGKIYSWLRLHSNHRYDFDTLSNYQDIFNLACKQKRSEIVRILC